MHPRLPRRSTSARCGEGRISVLSEGVLFFYMKVLSLRHLKQHFSRRNSCTKFKCRSKRGKQTRGWKASRAFIDKILSSLACAPERVSYVYIVTFSSCLRFKRSESHSHKSAAFNRGSKFQRINQRRQCAAVGGHYHCLDYLGTWPGALTDEIIRRPPWVRAGEGLISVLPGLVRFIKTMGKVRGRCSGVGRGDKLLDEIDDWGFQDLGEGDVLYVRLVYHSRSEQSKKCID
jgi:hypothetical protein